MGIGSHMVMVFKNAAVAAKYRLKKKAKKRHEKSVEQTKKKHAKLVSSRAGRRRRSSKKIRKMILAYAGIFLTLCVTLLLSACLFVN